MEYRQFKIGQKVKLTKNKATRELQALPLYQYGPWYPLDDIELFSNPWTVTEIEKKHRWTFATLENYKGDCVRVNTCTLQNMNLKPPKGASKVKRVKIGPNQYKVVIRNNRTTTTIFFSYDTPVVVAKVTPKGTKLYKTEVPYSQTTTRHMNNFLSEFGEGPYSTNLIELPQEKINAFLLTEE